MEAALRHGDAARAYSLAIEQLRATPDDARALFVAGVSACDLGRPQDAVIFLARAATRAPGDAASQVQLARALVRAGRPAEALAIAEQAARLPGLGVLDHDTLGVALSHGGAHAAARAHFARAVALAPERAAFRYNLAASLKFAGEIEAAEAEYEACLALEPLHGNAHWGLAQARRQTPLRNHTARLQALLSYAGTSHLPDATRIALHVALAKELDDLGEAGPAFEHLRAAKVLKRAGAPYSIDDDARRHAAIAARFPTEASCAGTAGDGCRAIAPIFVFGLPRSGTTLVEQILGCHPDVHGAGELPHFGLALQRLGTEADPAALGEAYRQAVGAAATVRPRFTDKTPMNYLHAGDIARALPRASLVCLRRHPLDAVLGNFRQLFTLDHPAYRYADDLLDCARYYLLFDRLLRHWQQVLPGRIHVLRYEALVADPERETRALLAHCGLPWHAACLQPERNAAAVATASATQVREPINARGIGRWRHYAEALAPARALLEAAGVRID